VASRKAHAWSRLALMVQSKTALIRLRSEQLHVMRQRRFDDSVVPRQASGFPAKAAERSHMLIRNVGVISVPTTICYSLFGILTPRPRSPGCGLPAWPGRGRGQRA
jgi:hypothetical protein